MPAMITLCHVEKWYGHVKALAATDLTVGRGDRVFVAGANGSGKSTLLRIVAGISQPTRGSIRFQAGLGPVAFVPQSGGFYPRLSLLRHLEIWCRLYDRGSPRDAEVTEAVECLGLVALVDRPLAELSGGYQKLAVLSCAFGVSPSILLLDEPLGGLDAEKAEAFVRLLSRRLPHLNLLMIAGHEAAPVPGIPTVVRLGSTEGS